jgi:hypothetical protein
MNCIGCKSAHLWNFETVERFVPYEGAVRSGLLAKSGLQGGIPDSLH